MGKRSIIFRGKSVKTGKWIFGDFLQSPEENVYGILPEKKDNFYWDFSDEYEVDPATVGQFTGLCDKNGGRVFEGDIVQMGEMQSIVVWDNRSAMFKQVHGMYMDRLEVIGNIHDK